MGVFIRKNGAWVNANTNLDIRDSDSFSSPTNAKVPKVNARRSGSWKQIYPPTEQTSSTGPAYGSGYISWQGSEQDKDKDGKGVWGWQQPLSGFPEMTNEGGQGYFGEGNYLLEENVFKEYAGWMGMTTSALNPNNRNIKKVTKLTITFDFRVTRYYWDKNLGRYVSYKTYVGVPTYLKYMSLIATKVANPTATNSDAANPTQPYNRSTIFGSDQRKSTNASAVTFTWTNANACEMVRQVMMGENGYKNICTYNGSRPIRNPNYNPPSDPNRYTNAYYSEGYLYTYDYTRYSGVTFTIDYVYQP